MPCSRGGGQGYVHSRYGVWGQGYKTKKKLGRRQYRDSPEYHQNLLENLIWLRNGPPVHYKKGQSRRISPAMREVEAFPESPCPNPVHLVSYQSTNQEAYLSQRKVNKEDVETQEDGHKGSISPVIPPA